MGEQKSVVFRWILPGLVVAAAIAGAIIMVALKPEVETRAPEITPPVVRVVRVELEDRTMHVTSQGTVTPRTESRLVPEVSGKVIWVSPSFVSGGFFDDGETLVRLDPFDYRQALVTARSDLARTKLRLAQEEAEARVARREWEELGQGDGNPLALREPQLEDAKAAVEAAAANVERAERDLARTEIRAPYAGRVREESVDVGQFVSSATPVGTVYAVDIAEVRLPLPDDELAFVDLPMAYRSGSPSGPAPPVTLTATFAGERHEWTGRIVRTEGEIDPMTRMVHAVAEIQNPYAAGDTPGRPPLKVGMFVEASIEGETAGDVAVLPRAALKDGNEVWVIDAESRLRYRPVSVYRTTETDVIVSGGLDEGDLVCVSPLDVTTDGMIVQIVDEEGKSL